MYIDSAAIITIASVLGALTAIGAVAYKIIKWFQAQEKQTSTCKVTAVNEKGTHKYHCISQDGKGVYGWVNAADVK